MSVANIWLGSTVLGETAGNQNLATNSFNLVVGALSVPSVVDQVMIKILGACTETLTIAKVPAAGTSYSTVVYTTQTSGHTSFFWQPDRPLLQYPGSYLKLNISNGDATGQIYAVVTTVQ